MRVIFGLGMVLAATSLSGCVSNTYSSLSNLNTGCSATNPGNGVACTGPTPTTGTGTGGATGPVTVTTTGTTTTTTTTVNTGNTATLTKGDTTLILEGSTLQSTIGTPVGISALKDSPLNHVGTNETADQQIWFNTNTTNNPNWPQSKVMTYSEYGTCINDGGVDVTNPGKCFGGTGGHGLGGDYKLYRYYQKNGYDEELQIWTWNQSYATQYRDVTASGTDPQHQAWSFGGNYTPAANVPTSGVVNYTGYFGATAKSSNFKDTTYTVTTSVNGVPATFGQTMSYNNNWRVNGTSALQANFGTGQFLGKLTSVNWEGLNKSGGFSNVNVPNAVANNAACQAQAAACDPSTPAGFAVFDNWINWNSAFMNANILLAGTITTDTKNTAKPNQIVGTAAIDPTAGWLTSAGTNPMYGGFFGPTANEVTGAFAVDGTLPVPNGGAKPINNDQRAYLQMSGIFNGQ